mgnify:CR=1 FL=1
MVDGRDGILEFCRRNWLGPPLSEEELLRERPNRHYSAGILFPRGLYSARFQRDERGDATGGARGAGSEGVDSGLDPIRTAQDLLPASAAISFHTTSERLTCHVEAGVYSRSPGRGYSRGSLTDPDVELTPEEPSVVVLDGRAELVSIWRKRDQAGGGVVTGKPWSPQAQPPPRQCYPALDLAVEHARQAFGGAGVQQHAGHLPRECRVPGT